MWAGFQLGKFSAQRREGSIVTIAFREGTQTKGRIECSQYSQRVFSIADASFSSTTRRLGHPCSSPDSHNLSGKKSWALLGWACIKISQQSSPVSSLAPSLSMSLPTPINSGSEPMAKLVFMHLALVETWPTSLDTQGLHPLLPADGLIQHLKKVT